MRSDKGFTLIELMVGMAIAAILMTLSGMALRSYWFAQSLNGATDEVVSALRELQEDAVSQSFPLVFGARFVEGRTSWDLIRYDPNAASNRCTSETVQIDSGVFNAGVQIGLPAVPIDTPRPSEYTTCASEGDIVDGDAVIWFYARGTSNGGSVPIRHPVTNKQYVVTVGTATGRVTRT